VTRGAAVSTMSPDTLDQLTTTRAPHNVSNCPQPRSRTSPDQPRTSIAEGGLKKSAGSPRSLYRDPSSAATEKMRLHNEQTSARCGGGESQYCRIRRQAFRQMLLLSCWSSRTVSSRSLLHSETTGHHQMC